MSPYIRRYAKYLNEKALAYRTVAFDFCKVKRGWGSSSFFSRLFFALPYDAIWRRNEILLCVYIVLTFFFFGLFLCRHDERYFVIVLVGGNSGKRTARCVPCRQTSCSKQSQPFKDRLTPYWSLTVRPTIWPTVSSIRLFCFSSVIWSASLLATMMALSTSSVSLFVCLFFYDSFRQPHPLNFFIYLTDKHFPFSFGFLGSSCGDRHIPS